jgi:rod shape-determining protein MreC
MHKKIATGRSSFTLFKRFKKRKVVLCILFYGMFTAVFHAKVGNYFSEKSRFFLSSARVALWQCGEKLEKMFLNFYCLLSHDTENILVDLRNLNKKLHEEIENLRYLQKENDELRKLLSLKESTQFSVKVARVVDIFSNDFTQSIILNVGKVDGVSMDDVVKNSDGLVGRITEVNDTWSRALLITDMNSSIPVKIGDAPVNAIMTGCNSNSLFISTIHEDIPINDGDNVKTSGYGICEDIYVGKIVKIDKKNMVKSCVSFNSLRHVIVISKNNNTLLTRTID